MRILDIQASPLTTSVSREISKKLLSKIREQIPSSELDEEIVTHVLDGENAPPHWSAAHVQASFTPREARSHEQAQLLGLSDRLCRELITADTLVIASPMWNFTIPSALKAWIDHVVRVGITFQYGAQGPEGLLSSRKKLYLVQASGGSYANSPMDAYDHVSPYLKHVFGFLGIRDITCIRAENTALDREKSVQDALRAVSALKIHPDGNHPNA